MKGIWFSRNYIRAGLTT